MSILRIPDRLLGRLAAKSLTPLKILVLSFRMTRCIHNKGEGDDETSKTAPK